MAIIQLPGRTAAQTTATGPRLDGRALAAPAMALAGMAQAGVDVASGIVQRKQELKVELDKRKQKLVRNEWNSRTSAAETAALGSFDATDNPDEAQKMATQAWQEHMKAWQQYKKNNELSPQAIEETEQSIVNAGRVLETRLGSKYAKTVNDKFEASNKAAAELAYRNGDMETGEARVEELVAGGHLTKEGGELLKAEYQEKGVANQLSTEISQYEAVNNLDGIEALIEDIDNEPLAVPGKNSVLRQAESARRQIIGRKASVQKTVARAAEKGTVILEADLDRWEIEGLATPEEIAKIRESNTAVVTNQTLLEESKVQLKSGNAADIANEMAVMWLDPASKGEKFKRITDEQMKELQERIDSEPNPITKQALYSKFLTVLSKQDGGDNSRKRLFWNIPDPLDEMSEEQQQAYTLALGDISSMVWEGYDGNGMSALLSDMEKDLESEDFDLTTKDGRDAFRKKYRDQFAANAVGEAMRKSINPAPAATVEVPADIEEILKRNLNGQ